eukprot:6205629-Pleurochrysis_carterae.AAC.2
MHRISRESETPRCLRAMPLLTIASCEKLVLLAEEKPDIRLNIHTLRGKQTDTLQSSTRSCGTCTERRTRKRAGNTNAHTGEHVQERHRASQGAKRRGGRSTTASL